MENKLVKPISEENRTLSVAQLDSNRTEMQKQIIDKIGKTDDYDELEHYYQTVVGTPLIVKSCPNCGGKRIVKDHMIGEDTCLDCLDI